MLRRHFVTNQQDSTIEDDYIIPGGYVDLGLSVMWAECNLGATSPQEPGLFYSRGNIDGHLVTNDGILADDFSFLPDSYKLSPAYKAVMNGEPWAKYNRVPASYDAVYKNDVYDEMYTTIFSPHIPTQTEWLELIDNTDHKLEVVNDIEGIRFTAVNGNSIFIPIKYTYARENKVYGGINTDARGFVVANDYDDVQVKYLIVDNLIVFTFENYNNFANSIYADYGRPIRGVRRAIPTQNCLIIREGYTYKVSNDSQKLVISQLFAGKNFSINILSPKDINEIVLRYHRNENYPKYHSITNNLLQLTSAESLLLNGIYEYASDFAYIEIPLENYPCVLTVTEWDYPHNTRYMPIGTAFTSSSSVSSYTYRINYMDIANHALNITWTGSSKLYLYFGKTVNVPASSSSSLIAGYYSINKKSSYTITEDIIQTYALYVDEYGFIYLKISSGNGNITFTPIQS